MPRRVVSRPLNHVKGARPPTAHDPGAILGRISGGRILDAATGDGAFIQFLLDGLRDHGDITGIDTAQIEEALFVERFHDHPGIRFELRDVLDQGQDDGSFANSLCVFADRRAVLVRLMRLLRPGGHLIVAADYRDDQGEPESMYVQLHDWWAAVDRVLGKVHHASQRRDQLMALVASLTLEDLQFFIVDDAGADPLAPAVITRIDGVIDRSIEKVAGHPELQRHGETLRARMHQVRFRSAAALVALGRK